MRFVTVEEYRKAVQAFQNGGGTIAQGGTAPVSVSDPTDLVNQIRAFASTPNAVSRRELATSKDRMLANDFKRELEDLLRKNFHPKNFDRMKLLLHLSTNPLAGVVAKLSKLYENPPSRYARTEKKAPAPDADLTPEQIDEAETAAAAARAESVDELDENEDVEEPTSKNDPELEQLLAELDLEEGGDDEGEEAFDTIAKASSLDLVLQRVEKLARAHSCVWVRPRVVYDVDATGAEVEDTGRLEFVLYTPAHADVLVDPDHPNRARAWFYWSEEAVDGKIRKVVNVFTESSFVKLDAEWKPIGGLEGNPLGRLPVAKFEIDVPTNGYYLEGVGDDLFEGTLEIAVLRTLQNARAKDAAFKQLAIQGDAEKVPADQVMGGPAPIMLGDGASATVLDLEANLEQWTTLTKERARELEARHGITIEVEAAGAPESGYAKKLRMSAVLGENRRVRPHFLRGERDLFDLIRRTLEIRPVPSLPKVPEEELVVDFAEIVIEENPKEQAETDARELKTNAISILDVLRRKNPDLSDAELARLAWRNKRINEALTGSSAARVIDFLSLGGKTDGGNAQPGAGGNGGAPVVPGSDETEPEA